MNTSYNTSVQTSTQVVLPELGGATTVKALNQLKKGVWVYFVLLIFEGALRKWVLPGLATPLLLIRDPVAIWLFFMAWKHGFLKLNFFITAMFAVSMVGFFAAILLGHGNFFVALFGVRTLLVHFPVIFVIGSVFDREDVLKIGRFLVWLTIPMTLLIMLQFYSPQSAWVNRGVGGDMAGAGFSGALGYLRPPATFSFTNGTSLFFGYAACFIIYFWLNQNKYISKSLLVVASFSLLMSIPLSISRGLFFTIAITLGFAMLAVSRKPKYMGRLIIASISIITVFFLLSQLSLFQTASDAFVARFTSANETEGGLKGVIGDRYVGGLLGAIYSSGQLPFFGYGIGMGTNVGSTLLVGKNQFLVAEGEWGRLIGELGIVLGLAAIVIRISVSVKIAIASYRRLSIGDILPWMLLSFCLLTLPQGQWSQPTGLGFSIVAAGLSIASTKNQAKEDTVLPPQGK
ncbi:hypothetical protein [Mucilaginibacter sp. OK098]|uniref:hypothetical protein n=1 Tax=Mucilaginibacter sp. OK098 TaxID=1855297 RepID=UPI0009212539|nr:hypothetical protein [Mucilaginibacter sp. OK098]SHN19524.1 hypothetical protein SAMN05216524_106308 [Mucilaginibacter sp. OK098]